MADHTRHRTHHEDEHRQTQEGERRTGLSMRCIECRFLIVVASVAQAGTLGWVRINTEDNSGLCRACRAKHDR